MAHIKINPSHHTKHPWRVHALCADFDLEDVWQVPIVLNEQHTLAMFIDQFKKADKELLRKGAAAFLFKFRRDKVWGVHMAVYVKPKSLFGKAYMLLIKPFRLWIVYPAMMKGLAQSWQRATV